MPRGISIDTSQNRRVQVALFLILFLTFLFNLISLIADSYSHTAVSPFTRAALYGLAKPESVITAGVTGLNGLHVTGAMRGGETYSCTLCKENKQTHQNRIHMPCS